jgi:hypothetical protein
LSDLAQAPTAFHASPTYLVITYVSGDLLVRSTQVGRENDLEAVPELPVGRLAERVSKAGGLGESDADHERGGQRANEFTSSRCDRLGSSALYLS